MTIVCNIWMICLELNWFVYDPSWMLHLSEFVWTIRSSVLVVFNNFLLIDATDKSKIRSDQKRFFIALSLYPLSFFANTPFKYCWKILLLLIFFTGPASFPTANWFCIWMWKPAAGNIWTCSFAFPPASTPVQEYIRYIYYLNANITYIYIYENTTIFITLYSSTLCFIIIILDASNFR